jgi:pilus assembly protein Flp/PilA
MKTVAAHFVKDESGVTAIEYALIAGLLSIVIIGAAATLGDNLEASFDRVADEVNAASTP